MRQPKHVVEYGPVGRKSPARSLLRLDAALDRIRLERFEPRGDLKHWIVHFWRVTWDLGEDEYMQVNVPHPNVNLSFEDDEAANGSQARAFITSVWPKIT